MKDEYKEMVCRVRFIDGVPAKTYLSDVEIVRCKDCKHGQKKTKPYMYCDIFGAVTETEWFCSKADRKDE